MKILFINHAYPQDKFDKFYADSGGLLQIPDNVLQWNIVDGFNADDYKNVVEFAQMANAGRPIPNATNDAAPVSI